jgi:hypothetical protein
MTDIDNLLNFAYPLCLEIPRQKKHLSLIFHKKKLLSIGRNCFKTHPEAKKIGYPYEEMHSELDAYRKVPKYMRDKKLTLINIRMNADGELRMSRPCDVCCGWCVEVFDRMTQSNSFSRTQYGYYLRRRCTYCWKSFFSVKIDILKKKAFISFQPKCFHKVSNRCTLNGHISSIPTDNEENSDGFSNEGFKNSN